MLSDKEPVKKNMKPTIPPFKLLEKDMEARQIPTRLIVGMAMPFAIVILILFIFSKKTPTAPPTATQALPVAVSSPMVDTKPAIRKPAPPSPPQLPSTPRPVQLIEARPKSPMEKAALQTPTPSEKKGQDLTFFKTLKDGPDVKQPLKPKQSPVETALKSNKAIQPVQQASAKVTHHPKSPLPPPLPVRSVKNQPVSNVKTIPLPPPAKQKTATVVKATPKNEPPPLKAATPVIAPPLTGTGLFTIQVGAFQKKEEAEQLAFRLKEHGYDAYVVVANIPNKGVWHRVRVGHYNDRAFATQAGEKLAAAEQLAFHVTSK